MLRRALLQFQESLPRPTIGHAVKVAKLQQPANSGFVERITHEPLSTKKEWDAFRKIIESLNPNGPPAAANSNPAVTPGTLPLQAPSPSVPTSPTLPPPKNMNLAAPSLTLHQSQNSLLKSGADCAGTTAHQMNFGDEETLPKQKVCDHVRSRQKRKFSSPSQSQSDQENHKESRAAHIESLRKALLELRPDEINLLFGSILLSRSQPPTQ